MRLIVKDHLLQLKEKDELDMLLCDVLFQMGYITDNRPETGNRQYGVDIRAHNDNEILLCVVKQGDLNRKNWDADQNAVRQSLNEIQDCYLKLMIKDKDREKLLRVVVVTNGVMDEAVQANWEGYVSQNTTWNGMCVQIEFWNVDKLTDDIQKYMFDEHIFGIDMQGLMRRALYFVGESDYHHEYYERIIGTFLNQFDDNDSSRECKKKISGMYLASQMIAQYAAEAGIYKIGIMVCEYLIIRYWKYMLEHNQFEKGNYVEWLPKFLSSYEKWNQTYYEAIRDCCEGENRFPLYNAIEQRVLLYEMLSYLVSYAYYLFSRSEYDKSAQRRCWQVHTSIVKLINNYPQLHYVPYDSHAGVLSMLYRLLDRLGRAEDISTLLQNQCTYLAQYYLLYRKYPSPIDSFEDAVNIQMGFPAEDYLTSAFWGTMLEWIAVMDQKELYQQLQPFLENDLAEVTKCVWFLKSEEECKLYDAYAMNQSGEGVAFEIDKTFEKLKENIGFTMKQYEQETFSFEKYSFEALEFIVSRYYGYFVRVNREQR